MTDPVFRFREETLSEAPIRVVFDTVTDHESYGSWTEVDEAFLEVEGSPERNGFGSVRAMRRNAASVGEATLDVREITNHYWPPYLFGYRVLDQSVVRDHQGIVLLEPLTEDRTKITWHMTATPTDPAMTEDIEPQFAGAMRILVADLASEAERRHKAR